jgi:hypothetical protein
MRSGTQRVGVCGQTEALRAFGHTFAEDREAAEDEPATGPDIQVWKSVPAT